MPAQDLAYRMRWLLLAVGVSLFAAGFWFIVGAPPLNMHGTRGTPLSVYPWLVTQGEGAMYVEAFVFVGVMLVTQWLFLGPRGDLAVRLRRKGRPMWFSIASAAFLATLLTTAFAATILEVLNAWDFGSFAVVWTGMGVVWLCWGVVLFLYWRDKDHKNFVAKTLRWLIRGSILEFLVATPVHAMVWDRGEQNCYCAVGSYTGLVLGGTVLIWAFGPALILLFLREKSRRAPILERLNDHNLAHDQAR